MNSIDKSLAPLLTGTLQRGDRYHPIWESPKHTRPVDRHNVGHKVKEFPGSKFYRPKAPLHGLL